MIQYDGNAVIYAIDKGQPIVLKDSAPKQTQQEYRLKTIEYKNKVVIIGKAASGLFRWNRMLESITGLNKFDTSQATDMSQMFSGNERVESLDLSSFNTSNVTDMHAMFENDYALKSLDVSNFNTSNVTNMESMFSCLNLTTLNVSNFNTSKVTNMQRMFTLMDNLRHIDVSNFDTSKVTTMRMMFMMGNDESGDMASRYGIASGKADVSKFNVDSISDIQPYEHFGDIHQLPNLISYLESFSHVPGELR